MTSTAVLNSWDSTDGDPYEGQDRCRDREPEDQPLEGLGLVFLGLDLAELPGDLVVGRLANLHGLPCRVDPVPAQPPAERAVTVLLDIAGRDYLLLGILYRFRFFFLGIHAMK